MSDSQVTCLECGRSFKRLNVFHLRLHSLDEKMYLEKYKNAELFSKKCIENISKGTKIGMNKPDSREKFMNYISQRDISGANNPFFGKNHTEEVKNSISNNVERADKISEKKKEWWSPRKGQTVEEIFGEDKGHSMRKSKSLRMSGKKNPAYGKVYTNAGYKNTKIGYYKGRLFRGIWEYSYYKYLESIGIDLQLVEYESFSIPYEYRGSSRTYTPDFLVKPLNLVVEIKSEYALSKKKGRGMIMAKKIVGEQYCLENGLTYKMMTEKDFPVRTYSSAYADKDIKWIKR